MTEEKKLTGFPSIDKPWLKYYTAEDLAIQVPKCTIYQNIFDRNKDYPDDVAILYYGNRIRYKTLFSEVEICAKALRQIGIRPGGWTRYDAELTASCCVKDAEFCIRRDRQFHQSALHKRANDRPHQRHRGKMDLYP